MNKDHDLAKELISWPSAHKYDELWRIIACVLQKVPYVSEHPWADMIFIDPDSMDSSDDDRFNCESWNGFLCDAWACKLFRQGGKELYETCWWKTAQFLDNALEFNVLEIHDPKVMIDAIYLTTHLVYADTSYIVATNG
jgi:hypothetical protein